MTPEQTRLIRREVESMLDNEEKTRVIYVKALMRACGARIV